MKLARWVGVLLVGLTGLSNATIAAPVHRAPAQPSAAQPPDDQGSETRIAAVVNDEAISVADLRSRLRMVMLSSISPICRKLDSASLAKYYGRSLTRN